MMDYQKIVKDSKSSIRRIYVEEQALKNPVWFLYCNEGSIARNIWNDYHTPIEITDISTYRTKLRKQFHREGTTDAMLLADWKQMLRNGLNP